MYSGALTEKLEKAENKHGMQTKWLKADESESFGGAYICYPYITEEIRKRRSCADGFRRKEPCLYEAASAA